MTETKTKNEFDCKKHLHEVENIQPMDPSDCYDAMGIESGFNWHGRCKNCGKNVCANYKEEYDIDLYTEGKTLKPRWVDGKWIGFQGYES